MKSKCSRRIFYFNGNLHEHKFLRQSEMSFNGLAQEGGKWTLVTTKGIAASNSGSLLPALRRIITIINGYFHDNSSLNVFLLRGSNFIHWSSGSTVPQRLNIALPCWLLISDGLLTFNCDIQIMSRVCSKFRPVWSQGPTQSVCVTDVIAPAGISPRRRNPEEAL